MNSRTALIIGLAMMLNACSLFSSWSFSDKSDLEGLSISADLKANNDMATVIDLVFISDQDLVNTLPKDSLSWFVQKQSWLDNNPTTLTLIHIELPPGKSIKQVQLPQDLGNYYQISAYLKYFQKGGQNRLDLTHFKNAYIQLGADKVTFGEVQE